MKIAMWHKSQNDTVEMWSENQEYDKVYVSKVFTESPDPLITNAAEVIKGGSGYDLENTLPYEIEHSFPDYSLYPNNISAIGMVTRGCPRKNHSFCITPEKDGCVSVRTSKVSEFWNGYKTTVLLDQNLLACKDKYDILEELAQYNTAYEFEGGLDIRFINEQVIEAFRKLKVKYYHFAWDDPREDLFQYFKLFSESGLSNKDQTSVYVLTNFWSSHEEDLERIYKLRELNFMPYVMIYDKQKIVNQRGRFLPDVKDKFTEDQLRHFKVCQHMQRWCNSPQRFIRIIPNFEDYDQYKNWKAKGMKI